MKRILIEYFKNLDNYGTGMMGLVAIDALARRYGAGNVEFHCDFRDDSVLAQAQQELGEGVRLVRYEAPDAYTSGLKRPLVRKLHRLWHLLFSVEGRGFDMIVVLGGDDLSEYYSKYAPATTLLKKWRSARHSRVVLLGQTIGPFLNPVNRFIARHCMKRFEIYARESNCVEYLAAEFGVKSTLMADLAIADLPLQGDVAIKREVLDRYSLTESGYATIVISGCQSAGRYYCRSRETYLRRFAEIVRSLASREQMSGKKIVLLAHTFGTHGNEAEYIEQLMAMLDSDLSSRVVAVTDMILPTRARHILGSGIMTITGRMHAAVSTFQMGRPALSLSYSIKYAGVIGRSIGRDDLIIEADEEVLWESGRIVEMVEQRCDYIFSNYTQLCSRISERIEEQKALIESTMDNITKR